MCLFGESYLAYYNILHASKAEWVVEQINRSIYIHSAQTFSFVCVCVLVCWGAGVRMRAIPEQARRGHQSSWSWSYRRLSATWHGRWGSELGSSGRAEFTFNHSAVSPAPLLGPSLPHGWHHDWVSFKNSLAVKGFCSVRVIIRS